MLPDESIHDPSFMSLVDAFRRMVSYRHFHRKNVVKVWDVAFIQEAKTFMRSETLIRQKFKSLMGAPLGSLAAREFIKENRAHLGSLWLIYGEGR